MDYKKHYDLLVAKAKDRGKPEGYFERHHVVPKSMGGSNEEKNLVNLTAREHFIAHRLLWRIHKNKEMTYAFHAMCKNLKGRMIETFKVDPKSSKLYAKEKEALAKVMSDRWKGVSRLGENNPSSKLTEAQVSVIKGLLVLKVPLRNIAAVFKVGYQAVWSISKGKSWAKVLPDVGKAQHYLVKCEKPLPDNKQKKNKKTRKGKTKIVRKRELNRSPRREAILDILERKRLKQLKNE